MSPKRKKRTSTPKSSDLELEALLIDTLKTGVVLAEKGLGWVESLAHIRGSFKSYPYLGQAFDNVKGAIGFAKHFVLGDSKKEVKQNERKKRRPRHKKVSKSKTVRHTR